MANPNALPEYDAEDFPLLQAAFKRRWPITDEARSRIVANVVRIGASEDSSPRDVVGAMKVLVEADKLEIDAVKVLVSAKEALLKERQLDATATEPIASREELAAAVAGLLAVADDKIAEVPRLVDDQDEYEVA